MSNPSLDEIKRQLRRECRRNAVSNADAASAVIVEKIATFLRHHPSWKCLASYVPLHGEPDLRALHDLLPNHTFVYPRIHGMEMDFHQVSDLSTDLVAGPWGLSEPTPHLTAIPLEKIDVMLCPGMAFTADGKRLGKGKGFYDRYLARRKNQEPYLIGITYSAYLLDHIPCEEHDIRMDRVITE